MAEWEVRDGSCPILLLGEKTVFVDVRGRYTAGRVVAHNCFVDGARLGRRVLEVNVCEKKAFVGGR